MFSDYTLKWTLNVPTLYHSHISTRGRHCNNVPDYRLKLTLTVPTLHRPRFDTRVRHCHNILTLHTKMDSYSSYHTELSYKYQKQALWQCPQITDKYRLSLSQEYITLKWWTSQALSQCPQITQWKILTVPTLHHFHTGTRLRQSHNVLMSPIKRTLTVPTLQYQPPKNVTQEFSSRNFFKKFWQISWKFT